MYDKKHTEETKEKMRTPRKNTEKMKKPKTPEHIKNSVEAKRINREKRKNGEL